MTTYLILEFLFYFNKLQVITNIFINIFHIPHQSHYIESNMIKVTQ